MDRHAKKCVQRYCELANETTQQLYKVSTPCIDDHHFEEEETKSVGELSKTCSQIVLKCLYLARIGRPDILWSVNKLARSITKWTKACDKRLNRLISYIHHTCEYKQYCHVGNTAKQCRLGLFQDSDFAGDLEDSKSTSGGTLCVFGSHTFLPISWMCKKQTAVSHTSTESEIISLDEGLRLDGITSLDLWIWSSQVLETRIRVIKNGETRLWTNMKFFQHLTRFKNENNLREWSMIWLMLIVYCPIFSSGSFVVCVWRQRSSDQDDCEGKKFDNGTCFQNPQSCSWLVIRSNQFGPPNFTRDEWNHLLCLFSISHCSSAEMFWSDVEKNAKRLRWRKSRSKIETDDEFSLAMQRKDSWRSCLFCIRKPGENQTWKSTTSELMDWAASKNGETCFRRLLFKGTQIFSWVEISWSDGSKNGETC